MSSLEQVGDLSRRRHVLDLHVANVDLLGLVPLGHLDVIFQVLFRGQEIADLLVVDLEEGGFQLVSPALRNKTKQIVSFES